MSRIPPSIEEVEFVTRKKLDSKRKEDIERLINEKLKRKITVKETIDEKVLGGVLMKMGSLMVDSSILGKLKENADIKKTEIEMKM